jgi:hypothetical protein
MNGGGGGGQRRNNQRNGNYADNGVAGGVLTGLPVDLKKRLDFSTKKQRKILFSFNVELIFYE